MRTHPVVTVAILAVSASVASAAPTCSRPIAGSGVVTGGNCVYDLAVGNGLAQGSAVARSGELHPVTVSLGRPFTTGSSGGGLLEPGFNGFSIRSWDTRTDYLLDAASRTLMDDGGYQCFPARSLPPGVVEDIVRPDGQVVGVRQMFGLAERGDDLGVVLEAIAHGTTFEDSAVEFSATVTNRGSVPVRVGLRFWSDSAVFTLSGHAYTFAPPDPPAEPWPGNDANWLYPLSDELLLSVTETPSTEPYYCFAALSVGGPWPLSPPATPPDRVSFSEDVSSLDPLDRGGPGSTCFAWEAPVPPRGPTTGAHAVEALAYFWGGTEASAIDLAPGESTTVRVWTWAFIENPVTCIATAPPGSIECGGVETPVTLDGTGSFTQDGNPLLYRWSSPDPRVRFDDPASATPVAFLPGPGLHDIKLEVGIGPYTDSDSLQVEVVDTTPPVLDIAPPVMLRTSDFIGSGCVAAATVGATALDACTDDISITHVTVPDIGSGDATALHDFPLGTTRIVFTATDGWGNVSTGETSVTLVDDVAPSLSVTATPSSLWPPNHRMKDVHVDADAADDCDVAPALTLLSIWSSERPDERGDGSTEPDIEDAQIGTPDFDFRLRAERGGLRRGREYAVTYGVTDASGNETHATAIVRVPHDQRRGRR